MVVLYAALALAALLVGVGVVLLGGAAVVRGLAVLREVNAHAKHDEAARDRVATQLRRGGQQREPDNPFRAIIPIAAAVLAGVAGYLLTRNKPSGCTAGVHPWPPAPDWSPFEEDDDDTEVELDLGSVLEAFAESAFGEWLLGMMRSAKAHSTAQTPDESEPAANTV